MEKFKYNTIDEAIAAIKAGQMVLVTDDEDRENEGDLIMAAELCTPEAINFMAKEARGLICMPADSEVMDKLQFGAMVTHNTDNHETAFSVSIDHVDTTTGISAYERAYTMKKCAEPGAQPSDFRRPGHVSRCAHARAVYWCVPVTPKLLLICASWQACSPWASAARL